MRHWISERVDGGETGVWRIGGSAHYSWCFTRGLSFQNDFVGNGNHGLSRISFHHFPKSRFTIRSVSFVSRSTFRLFVLLFMNVRSLQPRFSSDYDGEIVGDLQG